MSGQESKTPFALDFVAAALGVEPAVLGSAPPAGFGFVTSDSRAVKPGALFVALPGEKFDGHDFIPTALSAGASGVICSASRAPQTAPGHREVAVFALPSDTLAGYRALAAAWRRTFDIPVVAVAGSVGKTTTKEMLAAALSARWPRLLKTQGSQNGFVGIPLTLLELRAEHGVAVIEVGIDEIGAMQQHLEIVRPTAALVTRIGPEHVEKLKDLRTIAHEEGLALEWTRAHAGKIAIHADDPHLQPLLKKLTGPGVFAYGMNSSATPLALVGRLTGGALCVRARWAGASTESEEAFHCPLPGAHNAENLLGALAVAHALGLRPDEIRRGLSSFAGAYGRTEIRHLPATAGAPAVDVLCDYYNSNPTSAAAALALLAEMAGKSGGPRVACLADMLELGPDELRYHAALAAPVLAARVDTLLLFGPRMKALEAELRKQAFRGQVRHFSDHAALAADLRAILSGVASAALTTVLIKGSRGMAMEKVFQELSRAP